MWCRLTAFVREAGYLWHNGGTVSLEQVVTPRQARPSKQSCCSQINVWVVCCWNRSQHAVSSTRTGLLAPEM
jgi:hypothetical protein